MRKILLTIIASLIVIPSAFPEGGGHTVGNGGGLPEITLTKIWSTLAKTLSPCLKTLWACGAYREDQERYTKGLEQKESCGTKLKYRVLDGQEPFVRGENCNSIVVNQRSLYTDGKKPISDEALTTLALKMLITDHNGPSDYQIQKLVDGLSAIEHYSEHSVRQVSYKFLLLDGTEDFLTVENDNSLVLLNRHLYSAVACEQIESFELKGFEVHSARTSQFDVRGTFHLQCGTEKIIRSFKMTLPLNEESQVLEDYIEVTFN